MKGITVGLFLIACLFSAKETIAQTQSQNGFEILKGKNDSDIVYRGPLTFDDIRKVPAFNFEQAVNDYKPKGKTIQQLSNNLSNYELAVFLGTWCEDSHRMIPQLYKVLELANYPMKSLSLNALDRDKHDKEDKDAPYKITLVPTIIVLKDGKEVGRITEITDKSVEQDLLKIISQ